MRIIIAENRTDVRDALVDRMRHEGYEVDGVATALEFYRAMAGDGDEIALIDIDLPDEPGLAIASWLREKDDVGIILMTPRGDLDDRRAIRRSGADIYLLKPVDGDEMVQGVRNLARRIVRGGRARGEANANRSDWFFDPAHWALQTPDGASIRLTAAEMKFIQCLLLRPGEPVSRQALQAELGYSHDRNGDRSLEALIGRLRRKIEASGAARTPIQTMHGKGYLFSARIRMERRSGPGRGGWPGMIAHAKSK